MKIGLTEARIQVSLLGNPSNEGQENLFSPPHFNTIHSKIILDCTLQRDRGTWEERGEWFSSSVSLSSPGH